jgi:hypothetical protein
MSEKYNGWANYETWRVNLEMLDGAGCEDFGLLIDEDDIDSSSRELASGLESYCVAEMEMGAQGLALELVLSFLSKVDWQEIATHMVEDSISISHSN